VAETCRRSLELTIPAAEVDNEAARVVESIRQRVRIPGFRPGKAPPDLIRKRYAEEVRQEVIQKLVPRHFKKRAEEEGLAVVGSPELGDVHFAKGEPLRCTLEFEISPQFELKQYKDLTVPYQDPEVTDPEVAARLEQVREQKAEYLNVDPRPVEDGDHAVLSLESLAGVEGPPIQQDELMLHIGDPDTLEGFNRNLRGMIPGEQKEFEVTYPEDYGQVRLAGKTVRFRARLKGIRRKELPEINDEFARDLGDYQNLEELREAVRKTLFLEKQFAAQQLAKDALIGKLIELHDFPVPEAFVERQIELQVERRLQSLAAQGVDPRSLKLDWEQIRRSQRDKAVRDVKASILVNRVADAESIMATTEEVDREVLRIAKQERELVAAVRSRLEKEDGLWRIASRIRTDKTLNFLFEHARKTAEAE
jgi:trigger factor